MTRVRWTWLLLLAVVVLALFVRGARTAPSEPAVPVPPPPAAVAPRTARLTPAPRVPEPARDAPASPSSGAREARTAPPKSPEAPDVTALGGTPEGADPDAEDPEHPEEAPWPLDTEGIQAAVRAHMRDLTECYEGWLQVVPDLAGRVAIEIELVGDPGDALATVQRATVVESSLDHSAMDVCVLNALRNIPFEPPEDGDLVFTYPFVFADHSL